MGFEESRQTRTQVRGKIPRDFSWRDALAVFLSPGYQAPGRVDSFPGVPEGAGGHLEVGKNVYYTVNNLVHMVLALKPFGCMPSSQSDGVQSGVINKYKDMIFLPIETSGEGEVNAHSRVQMALGEAKAKARGEFETALKSTGKRLEDIKAYVAEHPELRRPFYHVPHRPGIAGTAAQFVLHVSDRMDKDTRFWRRSRVEVPAVAVEN